MKKARSPKGAGDSRKDKNGGKPLLFRPLLVGRRRLAFYFFKGKTL